MGTCGSRERNRKIPSLWPYERTNHPIFHKIGLWSIKNDFRLVNFNTHLSYTTGFMTSRSMQRSESRTNWLTKITDKSKNILLGVTSVYTFNYLDKDEWKVTQLLDKTHKQHVFSLIQNKLEDKLGLSNMSLTVVHVIHFRLSNIGQLLSNGHLHKLLSRFRYW
jgi:hypothetical protein